MDRNVLYAYNKRTHLTVCTFIIIMEVQGGVKKMITLNATDVRKDWSSVFDAAIREKPQFIKRTRDYAFFANIDILKTMLENYKFTADKYIEEDGSITLSLREIDLVVNDKSEKTTRSLLAHDINEYAEDYYHNFQRWYASSNRKPHLPYVLKVLIIDSIEEIAELINICQTGEN